MVKHPQGLFTVEIERLAYGGEGLGYFGNRPSFAPPVGGATEGKPVFVYGALPGELVLARLVQGRRKYMKAAVAQVLKASPLRRPPVEEHYLTCSPWQIMPEGEQLRWKRQLALEVWQKFGGGLPIADVEITPSPAAWGYRNKLEFSFCQDGEGRLSLAFHQRYRHSQFWPLDRCALGHPRLNEVAQQIVAQLHERDVQLAQLKNLLVRYSYAADQCLAALYVTDPDFPVFDLAIPQLAGWSIIHSDPRTPAAVTTGVLFQRGQDALEEQLLNCRFRFRASSFFQVNPPAFEQAAAFVRDQVYPAPRPRGWASGGKRLVDLYAGVGTFGLLLADRYAEVVSVEYDIGANQLALENAKLNGLVNVQVHGGAAERQPLGELFDGADAVIVDPPRSGLHPDVVEALLTAPVPQLIYVSCDPATQARDWASLRQKYQTTTWRLFDFYPQTPHVESIVAAERL